MVVGAENASADRRRLPPSSQGMMKENIRPNEMKALQSIYGSSYKKTGIPTYLKGKNYGVMMIGSMTFFAFMALYSIPSMMTGKNKID